jgi:hypothetical protein
MQSITFKTQSGTEIEVRNINTAATVDLLQAFVAVLDRIEENVLAEDFGKLNGAVYSAGLMTGGALGVIFPEEEIEPGDIDDYALDTENQSVMDTGQAQTPLAGTPIAPECYYYCDGRGGFNPLP